MTLYCLNYSFGHISIIYLCIYLFIYFYSGAKIKCSIYKIYIQYICTLSTMCLMPLYLFLLLLLFFFFTCPYLYICNSCILCMYVCIYICIHVCIYVCVCMYVCMYVYVYVYIYVYTVYIYIYIYMICIYVFLRSTVSV